LQEWCDLMDYDDIAAEIDRIFHPEPDFDPDSA
jgi:hypothetical protein